MRRHASLTRIVCAEKQPVVNFRMPAQVEQHPEAVWKRERGNISVEIRILFRKRQQHRKKPLVQHQSITAGMRGDHRHAFVSASRSRPGSPTDWSLPIRLNSYPTWLKRQFPFDERPIEGGVFWIGRIELLRVRQDLDERRAGIRTAVDFFDRIPSLRIDGHAREELVRMGASGL